VTEKVNLPAVLPINTPPRSELWQRHQLVRSLLSHRECAPEFKMLLLDVLDGKVPDEAGGRD
jgi:hypothetical protein